MLKVLVFVLAVMVAAAPAMADDKTGPDLLQGKTEIVGLYTEALRKNITQLRLADGRFVPAETAAELAAPVIPEEDAVRTVNRGILSALAEYCGLDWEGESFKPYMAAERGSGRWSDKQMAFIGALHGISQGAMLKGFEKKGACADAAKKKTQGMLDGLK